jgi:starvation-inducible DNA-binding protein
MKQLTQVLTAAFSSNFSLYYLSHVAHVNVVGRNFQSDHELFGGIYEDLQEQIDAYAEFLRTIDAFMPFSLKSVLKDSVVSVQLDKDCDFIQCILDENKTMIDCLQLLYEEAEKAGECGLSNYVQDRLVAHKKYAWMLKATLA